MKTVLSLAFAFQLVALSLQLQYIQDDVLGFPRYKIVLTHEKVSPSALARRDVEVRILPENYSISFLIFAVA